MRAIVWITESSWQACVDAARLFVVPDAEVTLLHVAPGSVEALAEHGPARRLGRRPPPGPPLRTITDEAARTLLDDARARLGRAAETVALRGRVEHEVLDACASADVLVLARDGEPRPGPKSLGRHARFVVDHAPCPVILV
jgi:nucleotide-binding universal stress UspA family protein